MITSELSAEGRGGAGIYVHGLSKELVSQGHEVEVIGSADFLRPCTYTVYKLRLSEFPLLGMLAWSIRAAVYARKLAERNRYDVINVHMPVSFLFPMLHRSRTPLIVTRHMAWPLTNPRYALQDKLFYFLIDMLSFARSSRLIVLNKTIARTLRSFGVPDDKIIVIPNGIDWKQFAGAKGIRKTFRSKFHLPKRSDIILTVGRLEKHKGTECLLEAVRMLEPNLRRRVSIVVAGEGPFRSQLTQESRDLQNVSFPGFLSRSDILAFYRESDLFVFTSRGGEGMATVLLEAMAGGLPIVATRVEGTTELIERDFGRIVEHDNPRELASAISELIGDRRGLKNMGAKACMAAKQYDWHVIAGRIVEVFESACRNSTDTRPQPAHS